MEVTLLKCLHHPSPMDTTAVFWNLPVVEQMGEITGLASASFFSLLHSDYCTSIKYDSLWHVSFFSIFLPYHLAFYPLPFFFPLGFPGKPPSPAEDICICKDIKYVIRSWHWSLLIFLQMSLIKALNKITAKTNSSGVPAVTSPQPFTFLLSTTCS